MSEFTKGPKIIDPDDSRLEYEQMPNLEENQLVNLEIAYSQIYKLITDNKWTNFFIRPANLLRSISEDLIAREVSELRPNNKELSELMFGSMREWRAAEILLLAHDSGLSAYMVNGLYDFLDTKLTAYITALENSKVELFEQQLTIISKLFNKEQEGLRQALNRIHLTAGNENIDPQDKLRIFILQAGMQILSEFLVEILKMKEDEVLELIYSSRRNFKRKLLLVKLKAVQSDNEKPEFDESFIYQ